MLRCRFTARTCNPSRPFLHRAFSVSSTAGTSSTRDSTSSDDELRAARSWLDSLHAEKIPLQRIGELSFSRSSGPGGQNVNKVNSKATLRVPLDALLHHIPTLLHAHLLRSRYRAAKSNSLVVQADHSRKQSDNARACYSRLYEAIVDAGHQALPNQTSADQVNHVKQLSVVIVLGDFSDDPKGPKADKPQSKIR